MLYRVTLYGSWAIVVNRQWTSLANIPTVLHNLSGPGQSIFEDVLLIIKVSARERLHQTSPESKDIISHNKIWHVPVITWQRISARKTYGTIQTLCFSLHLLKIWASDQHPSLPTEICIQHPQEITAPLSRNPCSCSIRLPHTSNRDMVLKGTMKPYIRLLQESPVARYLRLMATFNPVGSAHKILSSSSESLGTLFLPAL